MFIQMYTNISNFTQPRMSKKQKIMNITYKICYLRTQIADISR